MQLKFFYQALVKLRCLLLATLIILPTCVIAEEWIYTVRPGDNLWNLTERHLTGMQYVTKLQQLNGIQNPYVIPPGTPLRIPMAWTRMVENVHAQIVSVYGFVFIQRPPQEKIPAEVGMQLWAGDIIQSENDSFVTIEFTDNSEMRVQDNSRVRIKKMQILGDHGLVDTLIDLEQGRIENSVLENPFTGTRFRIQTPSAISSVRGTSFRVGTIDSHTATTSEVLSGNVNVSNTKSDVQVPAGFGTVTPLGAPPSPPVALLPPPDLSETSSYYESLPLVIHLKPLSGVKGYRAQIATDRDFKNLWSEFTTVTLPFRDGDIPDGDYWMRIRGIDASEIEGKDAIIRFSLNARPEPPFIIAPIPDGTTTPENQEFRWTTQSEASHYALMISQDSEFSSLIYFNSEIKENNLTLTEPLVPGHYFWRIFSVSANEGAGPFSDVMSFRVPYPGPALEETELGENEITFSWRAAATGQSFHFQLARDAAFSDIIYDEMTSASQITTQKPDGGTYYLRIKTIESDGFHGPWGPNQLIEIPRDMPYWLMLLLLLPLLILI
ncbi:FecR family protein [Nitrosomonas aestuarii]|uniref:FecR family protein n=1 Tax=Nitrosomonas aestuarii TaxID=52441 RepID=A0A1I3YM91_9PROT|nr:FecR domain-containing protein [Nitrosomonas aestuarii]SFK32870.1 FecR family protein [Nitrosomonas aestuarii]